MKYRCIIKQVASTGPGVQLICEADYNPKRLRHGLSFGTTDHVALKEMVFSRVVLTIQKSGKMLAAGTLFHKAKDGYTFSESESTVSLWRLWDYSRYYFWLEVRRRSGWWFLELMSEKISRFLRYNFKNLLKHLRVNYDRLIEWVTKYPVIRDGNFTLMTGNEASRFVVEKVRVRRGLRTIIGVIEFQFGYGIRVELKLPAVIKDITLSPDTGSQPKTVSLYYPGSAPNTKATVLNDHV